MTLIEIAGAGLATLFLLATLAWVYSLFAREPITMARWWGAILGVLNLIYFSLATERNWRSWALLGIISLWAVRSTLQSLSARAAAKVQLRRATLIANPLAAFRRDYAVQAIQIFLVSAPLFVVQTSASFSDVEVIDVISFVAVVIGVLLAERGARLFEKIPTEATGASGFIKRGLRSLSVEPKYYGELTLWSSFYLLALGMPSGFLTLFSPLLMSTHLRLLRGEESKPKP